MTRLTLVDWGKDVVEADRTFEEAGQIRRRYIAHVVPSFRSCSCCNITAHTGITDGTCGKKKNKQASFNIIHFHGMKASFYNATNAHGFTIMITRAKSSKSCQDQSLLYNLLRLSQQVQEPCCLVYKQKHEWRLIPITKSNNNSYPSLTYYYHSDTIAPQNCT